MKTTIIVAHPNWKDSKAIKTTVEKIKKRRAFVDIRVLDPKGQFNIKEEQEYLLNYDNIVYAFPFWWYSSPWNLKKYFDDILQTGFAFTYTGDKKQFKLLGKKFSYIVSTGNREVAYQERKANLYKIERFLEPLNAVFQLLSTGGPMLHDKAQDPKEYMFDPTILYASETPDKDIESSTNQAVEEFIKKI